MDYDSDIQTKVVRVNRTYNVYRGTSPSTQNRLEVSEVCPLCRLLLTIVICAFVKENLYFWKQHLFAAFLKICISKSSTKSFFLVSFYAFSYLCLLSGSVSSIARLKQFGGKA